MKKLTRHAISPSSHVERKADDGLSQNQTSVYSDQALLLTVKQAASLMNLSVATVYRLIQTEAIPSLLIRGSRRISREALQQWIREQQAC